MTDRIAQCQEIAKVLQKAAPALKQSPIRDNPEPKELRRRARLYGQLSARLAQVPLTRKELKKEADALSRDLLALEKELNLAAEIVSRHAETAAKRKSQSLSDKGGSPEKEGGSKRDAGSPEKEKAGAAPGAADALGSASPSPRDDSSPRRTRVVAGLVRPSSSSPDPWKRKEQNLIREYTRASRAAQGVGRKVQEAVVDLNKACR